MAVQRGDYTQKFKTRPRAKSSVERYRAAESAHRAGRLQRLLNVDRIRMSRCSSKHYILGTISRMIF
jgi:hypothetical protein